jgi:hypothetical protein
MRKIMLFACKNHKNREIIAIEKRHVMRGIARRALTADILMSYGQKGFYTTSFSIDIIVLRTNKDVARGVDFNGKKGCGNALITLLNKCNA